MKETDLSNVDISLFALVRLGGTTKKIHTEHIAWEAYQLAPERFSWRLQEFRDQGFPDKTPVRFALEQAKKKVRCEDSSSISRPFFRQPCTTSIISAMAKAAS